MNIWIRFWIYWALLTFGFWLYYPAYGQTATGNLVNPAGTAWGIPSAQVLNSAGILAVEGGGAFVPGSPYYNSDFNTIRFSYTLGTVAQSIAINSALAGTGIKWLGYDYSWQIQNSSGQSGGTLYGTVSLNGNNGKALESYVYNYPQGITPASTFLADSGRQLFSQSGGYTIGQVSSLDITWTGQDSLFWMGLYGPRVRNTDVRLLYGADLCAVNPLSDPTCPGYQTAVCTSNPLSSPTCPGYAAAYLQQQCTISALYDPSCPGYTTAYVTQQMSQTTTTTASTTNSTTTVSVTGTVSTTEPTITIATDGTVTTTVATVPEAEVNAVVTRQIPSTASPTGTVTIQVQTKPQEESEEERRRRLRAATDAEREIAMKEEKKREEEASERRKELAAKMRAAAQEAAVGKGREASRAQTMEQQVANQALIVATMNFVPGFESYGVTRLPDAPGYRPYEIYRGQQPVDNRRLLRGLTGASDQQHAEMVNSQYGR